MAAAVLGSAESAFCIGWAGDRAESRVRHRLDALRDDGECQWSGCGGSGPLSGIRARARKVGQSHFLMATDSERACLRTHKQAAERRLIVSRLPAREWLPLLQMIKSRAAAAVRASQSYLVYPLMTL